MTKKRNPNDATMRNIQALKKRCTKLERVQKLHSEGIRLVIKTLKRLIEG